MFLLSRLGLHARTRARPSYYYYIVRRPRPTKSCQHPARAPAARRRRLLLGRLLLLRLDLLRGLRADLVLLLPCVCVWITCACERADRGVGSIDNQYERWIMITIRGSGLLRARALKYLPLESLPLLPLQLLAHLLQQELQLWMW